MLANGDEVQIGKFRLVFLTGPKTDDDSGPGGMTALTARANS